MIQKEDIQAINRVIRLLESTRTACNSDELPMILGTLSPLYMAIEDFNEFLRAFADGLKDEEPTVSLAELAKISNNGIQS